MPGNAVVAQSGGPTAVINNSVRGVVETLREAPELGTVFGAEMGILGVLRNRLIDLSGQDPAQIRLLGSTPSAGAIGSCRYKLAGRDGTYQEDYARILEVFQAHDVGCFFYIGGNDSMDTANRVAALAREAGMDLQAIGIAKTVDNDVGGPLQEDGTFAVCDHNPGYGSVARHWALNVLEANEENKASCTSDPVLIMQAMGRKIGFITAAARLGDPERRMPLLIILPDALQKDEPEANLDLITGKVNAVLRERGRCMVVLTEGANLGDVGSLRDNFGHTQFSASLTTAAQLLMNHLNGVDTRGEQGRARSRLAVPGIARVDVPGTMQRRDSTGISSVDLEEAYELGAHAARLALAGKSGVMATILRQPGDEYAVEYGDVPLEVVANAERHFPAEWIAEGGTDVTDGFLRWATPLIGGPLPEFARLEPRRAGGKGLGDYTPQGLR
ncbi:MAG: diphosphate--fructose-6-phosphate 1-phosphotransferase [Planctomycetota bacterium]|jgi:6-phosphofructokinase 1